jgi:hypothetical protein
MLAVPVCVCVCLCVCVCVCTHLQVGISNLGISDIWDWIALCSGPILYIIGYPAATQVPTL